MIDEGYHSTAVAGFAGNSPHTIYRHYFKQTNIENISDEMNKIL